MIDGYGGVEAFYGHYYITALSPLGYVRHGKNLNYYDDKELMRDVEPFVLACIRRQLKTMPTRRRAFVWERGKTTGISAGSMTNGFFKTIIPLPHPRWVMQYRRKKIKDYIELYVKKLKIQCTL
jgi:hypothetical protein